MDPTQTPLWHGYTYRDIDLAARTVSTSSWWRGDIDATERYAAARFAITEYLIGAVEQPAASELHRVGRGAAARSAQDDMHSHGYDTRHTEHGPGALPGFQRYWHAGTGSLWDERIVERVALHQIWPHLSLVQQQAVMALALTEDHQAAADQLGIPLSRFSSRLRDARRIVLALWHEHETPRRLPRDKRAGWSQVTSTGRRRLTVGELEALRDRIAAGAKVSELASEIGYSRAGLYDLLSGKKRPAPDPMPQAA